MPKQTKTSRKGRDDLEFTQRPKATTQIVDPNIQSLAFENQQGLAQVFGEFFGDLGGSASLIADAASKKAAVEAKRENDRQREVGTTKANLGEHLTPDEEQDDDFVQAYITTKGNRMGALDGSQWVHNNLKNIDLTKDPYTDPQDGLLVFLNGRAKGMDERFKAYYVDAATKTAQKAIVEHRAQLFNEERIRTIEAFDEGVAAQMTAGGLTDPQQYLDWQRQLTGLYGQADASKARQHLLKTVLTHAALAGPNVLSGTAIVLNARVEPTPDNPDGRSIAERFPEMYESLAKQADDLRSLEWTKAEEESFHVFDKAQSEKNVSAMLVQYVTHANRFGKDRDGFKKRELVLIGELQKQAETQAAHASLMRGVNDPELLRKYGTEVLHGLLQSTGPAAAVDRMVAWNTVPSDFKAWMQGAYTKASDPQSIANMHALMGALADRAPDLFNREMSEDAKFIHHYMRAEGNLNAGKDTLTLAREAATVLQKKAENPDAFDPRKVRFWAKPQDEAKWRADFSEEIGDSVRSRLGEGMFEGWGTDVRVPPAVFEDALLVTKRHYLNFLALGRDPKDAEEAARDLVKRDLAQNSRYITVPSVDGHLVVQVDRGNPQGAQWRRTETPDGTYDPTQAVQSDTKRFPWINDGNPVGIEDGVGTRIDGGRRLLSTRPDTYGMPIRVATGQTVTYQAPTGSMAAAPGLGELSGILGATEMAPPTTESLKIPKDRAEADKFFSEKFKGTGVRAVAVAELPNGQREYELEFIPSPPESNIDMLEAERDAELGLSPAERNAERTRKAIEEEFTRALDSNARGAVQSLQTTGLLPDSIGTTVSLPTGFQSGSNIVNYLNGLINSQKESNGQMPVESNDTPVGETYVARRKDFIEKHEQRRSRVYDDDHDGNPGTGHPTVGIGFNLNAPHVVAVMRNLDIDVAAIRAGRKEMTDDEMDRVFEILVGDAEAAVSRRITAPLTADQRLALVSLVYNGGEGLLGPKITAAINSGDWKSAVAEVLFNSGTQKPAAKKLPGLKIRRRAEAALLGLPVGLDIRKLFPA